MEYEDPAWFGDLRVPDIYKPLDPEKAARLRRAGRLVSRTYTDQAKDVPCVDCGIKYPPHVMDFDHVRGVKVDDISRMVRVRVGERRLQAEINKCDVVCANCHRERSHQRSLAKRLDTSSKNMIH